MPEKTQQNTRARHTIRSVFILLSGLTLSPAILAADLEASSFSPRVTFDDSSNGLGDDWTVRGEGSVAGFFSVIDNQSNSTPISIETTANNDMSFVVDEDGDLTFADGGMFFNRSNPALGIGTTTPFADIHIIQSFPSVLLDHPNDADGWATVAHSGSTFQVRISNADNTGSNIPLSIVNGAPSNSLVIGQFGDVSLADERVYVDASTNHVGINTFSPLEALHIVDPSPVIRLEDPLDSDSTTRLGHLSNAFRIWVPTDDNLSFSNAFSIFDGAPADAVRVLSDGRMILNHPTWTEDYLAIRSEGTPRLFLADDTSENGAAIDWTIGANNNLSDPKSEWFLDNNQANGSISVIRILAGDTTDNQRRSLEVQPNGEVTLANDAMRVERTGGNVGIGTIDPAVPLHVVREDGAMLRVENTSTTEAPRDLFELVNDGNTKFIITNTKSVGGSSWGFTNNGDDFRISKQGTGSVEFRVFGNGNALLAGTLTENSDRYAKTAIRAIDGQEVLERVAELPVSRWQYRDAPGVDHIGPMAQDFRAAFGLGDTDTGISTLDTSGVALAAIQALNEQLQQKDHEIDALKSALTALEGQVAELAARN